MMLKWMTNKNCTTWAIRQSKGPVQLTDEHNSVCKKDTADDQSFGVGVIRFHLLQKSTKLTEIRENKMEKNGQG